MTKECGNASPPTLESGCTHNAVAPACVPEHPPSPDVSSSLGGQPLPGQKESTMHSIIYLVGLIVVILAILSLFGLR
jgi:hypothetical protein